MARHKLTQLVLAKEYKAALAAASAENTIKRIRDGDNLVLAVRASGVSSWQLNFLWQGKKTAYTIGHYPAVTLATAREVADQQRERLAKGINPNDTKRAAAPAASAGKTIEEIGEEFISEMRRKKRSAVYLHDMERGFGADLYPRLGRRIAVTITPADIDSILRPIEARGSHVQVRRFLGWVRAMFDMAKRYGVENPCPARGRLPGFFEPAPTVNRPGVKSPQALQQLLRAVAGWEGSVVTRAALLIHAHTFVRPTELQMADWTSVRSDVWAPNVVLESGDYEHLVPMTPQVVALFEALRPVHPQFIVPGRRYGKRISEATLNAGLHALGYKGVHCTHGFRTTASTLLREMGWDGNWVERQLSHGIQDAVEGAYNKALYLPMRTKMLRCWSDYLDALMAPGSTVQTMQPHEWKLLWETTPRP